MAWASAAVPGCPACRVLLTDPVPSSSCMGWRKTDTMVSPVPWGYPGGRSFGTRATPVEIWCCKLATFAARRFSRSTTSLVTSGVGILGRFFTGTDVGLLVYFPKGAENEEFLEIAFCYSLRKQQNLNLCLFGMKAVFFL